MYVILTYDLKNKRVRLGLKICRKYLRHVQKSVFEGYLTQGQLKSLQRELKNTLVPSEDKVCIYCMGSTKFMDKILIGQSSEFKSVL